MLFRISLKSLGSSLKKLIHAICIMIKMKVLVTQLCLTLCDPMDGPELNIGVG